MDLGLKDRVALVAASSHGLGKAIALGLAREGAKLALCARTQSTLDETAAEEIRAETGVEVLARATDVTSAAQVRALVAEAHERFGRIDICVANSAALPPKASPKPPIEEWRKSADLT